MIVFPVAFYALAVFVVYRQYGLVPCLVLPLGLVMLAGAWFSVFLWRQEVLVFPFLVLAALCFSLSFAFRRSAERALEIRWEERQRACAQHARWLANRNSVSVQDAWANREPFWGPRRRT